ncbi:csbC [Symbiodinium sp. CCMP2592]|nr:csbC [Symbiodinium sp. CCMP2592]
MFWRLAILAVGAGLLFGVDLASIGAAVESMSKELQLDKKQTEWVVSCAKGGAIFGSLFGGALIMSRGRRTIIGCSAIPSMIGPALVFTAQGLPQLIVGRFLMGIGIGLASVATPNYLSEVVRPEQRGLFEAMYELGIASGMLLAALVNALLQMLSSDAVWRYQAGCVPFVFAFPVLIVACTVPESPRWMLQTKGSSPSSLLAALQEISSLRRPGAEKRLETWRSGRGSLEEELSSDTDTAEAAEDDLIRLWDDRHLQAGNPLYSAGSQLSQLEEKDDEPVRLRTLSILQRTLKDACAIIVGSKQVPAGARRGLGLALAAAVLDQACASTSILIYAQKMLARVGIGQESQDMLTLLVVGAKMFGVILGLAIVERMSRRTLLGAGGSLSAVALLILVLGAAWSSPVLLLSGMSSFIAIFYSTWGIGYWIVVVEVTAVGGPRYASAAQSVSTATLFAAGWLTSLTFIDVISLGPPGLLIYVAVAVLMGIYGFCILPETGGHSLEECAGDIGPPLTDDESESDAGSGSS